MHLLCRSVLLDYGASRYAQLLQDAPNHSKAFIQLGDLDVDVAYAQAGATSGDFSGLSFTQGLFEWILNLISPSEGEVLASQDDLQEHWFAHQSLAPTTPVEHLIYGTR